MTRTFIAAVLAFLVLAPAANARLIDEPAPANADTPLVQSERITDHRADAPTSSLAGTTDESSAALAQEAYYKSQGDALAALAKEQESVSGAGNQGVIPSPDSDGTPWTIVAIAIAGAGLLATGLVVVARRTRTNVAA